MFEELLVPSIAPCSVGAFLKSLDDDSRANLIRAMALPNTDISHNRIALEIRAKTEGKTRISPETVSAHRNGVCRCSKD